MDLETERALGTRAQHAYDSFIKGFVENKKQVLFEAFRDLPVDQADHIMEVKRTLMVLEALEIEVQTIIDTGKMASQMIEKDTKH